MNLTDVAMVVVGILMFIACVRFFVAQYERDRDRNRKAKRDYERNTY